MHSSRFIHSHTISSPFYPHFFTTYTFFNSNDMSHTLHLFTTIIPYFHSLAHKHPYFLNWHTYTFLSCAHMHFSYIRTLALTFLFAFCILHTFSHLHIFESSFALITTSMRAFLIGHHNSCGWDQKAS